MKIYFASSLAGGRNNYVAEIIQWLKTMEHEVLSEHVGQQDHRKALAEKLRIPKEKLSYQIILRQDLAWVEEAECMIAEVSSKGSYGVGREIERNRIREKIGLTFAPLLLIYQKGYRPKSALILGEENQKDVWLREYSDLQEAKYTISEFINKIAKIQRKATGIQ